jgi:hypothetical protein
VKKASEIEKAKVKYELNKVRRELSGGVDDLGDSLDMKERFKSSFRKQAGRWILGGVVTGVGIALILPRKKRAGELIVKKRGAVTSLFLNLLGLTSKQIISTSLPFLTGYAKQGYDLWSEKQNEKLHNNNETPSNEI